MKALVSLAIPILLFFVAALLSPMVVVAQNGEEQTSHIDTAWVSEIPVVELTYDAARFNSDSFIPAKFTLYKADSISTYTCSVRQRGGTSLVYDKPNYAVKFYDEAGQKLDVRLLDMRKDNHWILDGMAMDHSKMRNRVSMDVWLASSRPPYHQELEPKAINGYRGRYVEVYANGDYMGVFCLMERVDRKQLKLKKYGINEDDGTPYLRGVLYKAINGKQTRTPYFYWNANEPDDASSYYDGVQGEYPDVHEGEPWSWQPLRKNIYFLCGYTGTYFSNNIGKRYDLPVFIDFVLFLDLLYAYDNVGKNYMCWFYDFNSGDLRLGVTPWDLDATWGLSVTGTRIAADTELSNKTNFNTRMSQHYRSYADTLAVRYAALRDSLWTETALCGYFDRYFDLLDHTGAWQRDQRRWENYYCKVRDMEPEQQFIHQWIHDRLAFLDKAYGYVPPQAISRVPTDPSPQSSPCYDLFGRRLASPRGLVIREGKITIER